MPKKLSAKRAKENAHPFSGGFTLLEVMFVIAIFAIMASIVLFRFRDFGTQTSLDNLAQDVALRIIGAQKTAISGNYNSGFSVLGDPSYGMYFVAGAPEDTANHEFVYFADLPSFSSGTAVYDHVFNIASYTPPLTCPGSPTAANECISVTGITTGEYISNICYINDTTGGGLPCVPIPGGEAHITFTRPFPAATLKIIPSGGVGGSVPIDAQKVFIELTSNLDPTLQKTIVVTSLGEVHIFNGCASVAYNPAAVCSSSL